MVYGDGGEGARHCAGKCIALSLEKYKGWCDELASARPELQLENLAAVNLFVGIPLYIEGAVRKREEERMARWRHIEWLNGRRRRRYDNVTTHKACCFGG